jgi:hypothetical protein
MGGSSLFDFNLQVEVSSDSAIMPESVSGESAPESKAIQLGRSTQITKNESANVEKIISD